MRELTNDADKMICCLYREYLSRRSNGVAKRDARRFTDEYFSSDVVLSKWLDADISDTKLELGRNKYLQLYISDEFELREDAIIYMESRFKNGLSEVLDLISKFIP